jgi:hypothetical protein
MRPRTKKLLEKGVCVNVGCGGRDMTGDSPADAAWPLPVLLLPFPDGVPEGRRDVAVEEAGGEP